MKRRGGWIMPTAVGVLALLAGCSSGHGSTASTTTSSATAAPAATVAATQTAQSPSPAPAATTSAASPTLASAAASPTLASAAAPTVQASGKVIVDLQGDGVKTSADFTVTQPQWAIRYSYDCSNSGNFGNFAISVSHSDGSDFDPGAVNALGAKGQDKTDEFGAGTFHLSVTTACSWHIQVLA